ncbi:MAG: C1 family peptidase [Bacteroidales bacterium]|nr:C1 family peptidase [Bacteroidales bacterium]
MKRVNALLLALFCFSMGFAQNAKSDVYKFSTIVKHAATPVKNQAVTGTCWSFATTSFLESELLRAGKGEYGLSEMHTVRYNYINRINDNFVKAGKGNLGEGSLSHMLIKVVKEHGMVPDEVYDGINYNSKKHNHSELNGFVNAIASAPVALKNKSPEYEKLVNSLLDIYLGRVPSDFVYKGKNFTPLTFFSSLKINLDDYVEITSFSHHPYYSKFALEIPDNWDYGNFYNLPLDEFMQIIDFALKNGHTVCWDGDMSEKSYSDRMGLAVNATKEEMENEKGKELSFAKVYEEDEVTPESRQKGFESNATTDDHLMHLIGLAKDENGVSYYIVKNSWKPEINRFGGYNYLSENYVKAKTISILVHKSAIPKNIREKLNL